ncbi:MAG: hypothetical protein DWQ02_25205 [Bacteroidetes bacterium]|nr:MAG: hypothetical protein DWQ02_25205 [Bacteroidota bacterium]
MSFIGKILVESPGLHTTIQDIGRNGFRRFGVPQSGVMDEYSARLANLLVGNNPDMQLLEISFTGPGLVFHEVAVIGLTGADISANLNRKPMAMYETVFVKKGDELSFGKLKSGCRAYLSIGGGLIADYVMESCSTYSPGKFGGYQGRSLKKGDWLFYHHLKNNPAKVKVPEHLIPVFENKQIIRVLRGPEWVGEEYKDLLEDNTFIVGKDTDRMGMRLEGRFLESFEKGGMVSSPLAPGVIQMVPSGELIISMKDGQTTGGYPRVASIISADLGTVAQLRPGDEINFKLVDNQEAKTLFLHLQKKVDYLYSQIGW